MVKVKRDEMCPVTETFNSLEIVAARYFFFHIFCNIRFSSKSFPQLCELNCCCTNTPLCGPRMLSIMISVITIIIVKGRPLQNGDFVVFFLLVAKENQVNIY